MLSHFETIDNKKIDIEEIKSVSSVFKFVYDLTLSCLFPSIRFG